MEYSLLIEKAELLLDSNEYKFTTSSYSKLYDALSDATHLFHSAKNWNIGKSDATSLKKYQILIEAIPETNIIEWIEGKSWEQYL